MKVIFAAGGTGGHIYPAIAVANEIRDRHPSAEILFVGTARGLETQIVPENGFQLSVIHSAGLKGVGISAKLKGLALLPRSFAEARRIIRDFEPDVVVGAGGYVSGPVVLMASFARVPTMVMDSNALPGFTNRRLAMFVDKAALTFEEALPFFGKKGVVTGNPVRKEFFGISACKATPPFNLLVFGGSQGARAINKAVIASLETLAASGHELSIVHQTGGSDLDTVTQGYAAFPGLGCEVRPYIKNIVDEFQRADLIICRAGATTCSEITASGRASIMIPLPTAADDHQRRNAEALEQHGAAVMILQSALTGDSLSECVIEFLGDPARLDEMGEAARKMSRPDAAGAVAGLIEELAGR